MLPVGTIWGYPPPGHDTVEVGCSSHLVPTKHPSSRCFTQHSGTRQGSESHKTTTCNALEEPSNDPPDPARLPRQPRGARWSPANIYGAARILERLQKHLAADELDLLEAGAVDLQEFLNAGLDAGLSPNTVIVHYRQLKAFYGWAATVGVRRGRPDDRDRDPQARRPRPRPDAGHRRGRLPGDAGHLPGRRPNRPGGASRRSTTAATPPSSPCCGRPGCAAASSPGSSTATSTGTR